MSFGFLGIQFGFALQNANTSRIFETLGADTSKLVLYWLAAPITGLVVQPIIGYYSDRTWHPVWGRRRPYFTAGALAASVALFLMPNSPALWIAVSTLWIMDASINVSMEPFRAFVGDILPDEQRTGGFAMQSFFIGTGAIIASFLPWMLTHWLGVSSKVEAGTISDHVRYSFYIGAGVLLATVLWTVFRTKEYPPEPSAPEFREENTPLPNAGAYRRRFMLIGILLLLIGAALAATLYITQFEQELYVLCLALAIFAVVHLLAAILLQPDKPQPGLVHIVKDFYGMPRTMIQLAAVQFFSWFALFAMWIYTTPAVTSHIFHATDPTSEAYNTGADLVGNLFGIYSGIAAVAAFLLPILARATSRRFTHLVALACGGLGLISFYFAPSPAWLWLAMVGVGIAWASILSVPYAMLSGSLPPPKMGYYMGVFNFFIVIPQIVAGTILGVLLKYAFDGQSIFILVTGGVSMIIAGLLCLRVDDRGTIAV
jgi:maltose/moltooligosaccharide transporter